MPSHLSQTSLKIDFAVALDWDRTAHTHWGGDRIPNAHMGPDSIPWVAMAAPKPDLHTISWGFRPLDLDINPITEVGINRASSGRYLRHMWAQGRVIVPVDGWMEGGRQVRAKDGHPCLLAAICNWRPFTPHAEGTGFVLIVDGAGVVDPTMRGPVVLTAAYANAWMNGRTSAEEVMQIARRGRRAEEFEW
jgi:putative SOS response-associated peptidase YedK